MRQVYLKFLRAAYMAVDWVRARILHAMIRVRYQNLK